jgi:hypothetical protein
MQVVLGTNGSGTVTGRATHHKSSGGGLELEVHVNTRSGNARVSPLVPRLLCPTPPSIRVMTGLVPLSCRPRAEGRGTEVVLGTNGSGTVTGRATHHKSSGGGLELDPETALSYSAKYKGDDWIGTAQLQAQGTFNATYWRKLSERHGQGHPS